MAEELEESSFFKKLIRCNGPLCLGQKRSPDDFEEDGYCYECYDYLQTIEETTGNITLENQNG